MVEGMIQAEPGPMIATLVIVLELHEGAQTRAESKEVSPDSEFGKYSFLFCVHYTKSFTAFVLTSKSLVLPSGSDQLNKTSQKVITIDL